MKPEAIETLASALMAGTLPEAQPWDVGAAATWIADALVRRDATTTPAQVRLAMRALNGHRLFEHTRLLGQTWKDCCPFDPVIAKHHAQALIELSALDAAEQLLLESSNAVATPGGAQAQAERLEYEGLLGRIDKQRFVSTLDKDLLVRATDRYLTQFRQPSRPYWHGINAVALLAREEREGVGQPRDVSAADLASDIYRLVTTRYAADPRGDAWLTSTASEASLALGECDQAELWLYRFLYHPAVQPFFVNSYDRQLREIWQGSAAGGQTCADRLAGILGRHVLRTQAQWSVSTTAIRETARKLDASPEGYEKNFSGETGFSVEAIKRMLAACSSIGCVTNTAGERLGTGFLIGGGALKDAFAGPVFITNAHVISDTVPNAIRPQDARVTFEVESVASGSPVAYPVQELLFSSVPGEVGIRGAGNQLDVTIVRLAGLPAACTGLPTSMTLPLIDARAKAYVVGHPRGAGLQISLHDSLLLDVDDYDCLVHYRTPTDPGSSGSPVFNRQWEVIAVHHSGSSKTPRLHGAGFYEANEGISLASVRQLLHT